MADTADDHPRTGHGDDEMHGGISYLREDIQDLRAMIVRLEARFDDRLDRQDAKFDEIHRVIREQGRELTQRMVVLVGLMTTVILAAIKL